MKPLKREDIKSLIRSYINEALDAEEDERLMCGPVTDELHQEIMEGIEGAIAEAQKDLRQNDFSTIEKLVDNQVLQPRGIEADKDSYEYKKLCRETIKAMTAFFKVQKKRESGDYSDELENPLTSSPVSPAAAADDDVTQKPKDPSIGSLKENWFLENERADTWKPRTHKQYTGYFTIFLQILGEDTPVDTIDHATVRHIKETLLALPAGMNKKAAFKDKTVPEILEINKTEGHETLSVNTINGYITCLGAFFKWCVGNGYMSTNYADGAKIKVNRQKRPDQIRQAFSPQDLRALFGSPDYKEDKHKESYQFWLPVLGLYTGARINELCQLRLDDIQAVNGIPSLILQEDSKDSEVSIKNSASMRTVPLHPFVANKLNLMGHVQAMREKGETRLFPELPYQNFNYGHKATKWFGRYKQSCGIDSKQKVFHSFRHTLSDNLKQQLITETIIDELTGHAVQGETMGRYGKRYPVETLYKEAVLKLDYKVALEHLKGSKWTK